MRLRKKLPTRKKKIQSHHFRCICPPLCEGEISTLKIAPRGVLVVIRCVRAIVHGMLLVVVKVVDVCPRRVLPSLLLHHRLLGLEHLQRHLHVLPPLLRRIDLDIGGGEGGG